MPAALFHRIPEPDSAAARRRLAALDLAGRVELRNVHFESHGKALRDLGGDGSTPALWDGKRLHRGLPAVRAALERLQGATSSRTGAGRRPPGRRGPRGGRCR